jgi:hypothetical protein
MFELFRESDLATLGTDTLAPMPGENPGMLAGDADEIF